MDKTAIKNFSVWARNALIRSVADRCGLVGVRPDGIQEPLPQSTRDMQFFDAGTGTPASISGDEIKKRDALVSAIRGKERDSDYKTAYNHIVEQVAYTWFNRLIAIRFMEVNDYLPSRIRVLSSEQAGKLEPDILATPFDAEFDFTAQERDAVIQWKDRGQKEDMDALFRLLFVKQCDALHEILPNLFQKVDGHDYTELLLNISFTDRDGVVYRLVNDIPESNFDVSQEGQVEIIGWLYQYYNAELKDDTFALLKKNVKITKERIPAATQLFTPDWIVKYMVENSLGRLWVEGHPNDGLKENWRYYLEEAEQEPEVEAQLAEIRQEYAALNPEDIKVIDPCMGSGHILVYAFDVLMQIYESQGYTQRDAAQSILANNLFGLDIDERAAQLAYFAVMMKARQYDRRILTRGIWPHVLAIQESNGIHRAHLDYFGAGMSELEKNTARMQLEDLLETLRDAKEYGSILRVENWEWDLLRRFVAGMDMVSQITLDSIGVEDTAEKLMHLIDVGQVLAQKYNVAVTNPPYMGSANMGPKLLRFVKENYADYKSDLFAVFILRLRYFTEEHGLYSLITQQAWMFKSSYRNLRPNIYRNLIISLLHLGAHAFDELNGEVVQTVAFVQQKYECLNYIGNYISLEEYPSETEKEEAFLTHSHIYGTKAKSFMEIPNQPTAYWITEAQANCFDNFCTLSQSGVVACAGLNTSDNDRFVRLWQEVDIKSIAFHASKHEDLISSGQKYAPFNKGGGYRKWYGNQSYIIAFNMENYRILSTIGNHLPSRQYYFRPCLTWNRISSAENFSVRYCDSGFVFDDVSPSAFMDNNHFPYTIGLMNAKPYSLLLRVLNKGMKTETGNVQKTPFAVSLKENEQVTHIADDSIQLSRKDWDSYETSWDFKRHPLV